MRKPRRDWLGEKSTNLFLLIVLCLLIGVFVFLQIPGAREALVEKAQQWYHGDLFKKRTPEKPKPRWQ